MRETELGLCEQQRDRANHDETRQSIFHNRHTSSTVISVMEYMPVNPKAQIPSR